MAILVFGVGQLVIPLVAKSVVRGRVDKYGRVLSVSVSAVPAIELAFDDADTVTVHMSGYRAGESTIAHELSEASGVTNLNVAVNRVTSGLFSATDVRLTKRGKRLVGTGSLSEAALQRAIPGLDSVKLISSRGGVLTLAGDYSGVTAEFTASASGGRIVAAGVGFPLDFFHLTVWSDPQVRVTSLSATATASGMTLTALAQMR